MTAADLIAKLRAHPKACGEFGIICLPEAFAIGLAGVVVQRESTLWVDATDNIDGKNAIRFITWLHGALLLKCDELGLWPQPMLDEPGYHITRTNVLTPQSASIAVYPTVLDAMLAGIEAALQETT